MMRWEYCTLAFLRQDQNWQVSLTFCTQAGAEEKVSGYVDDAECVTRSNKLLGLLGFDGWELVSVESTDSRRLYYFKRNLVMPAADSKPEPLRARRPQSAPRSPIWASLMGSGRNRRTKRTDGSSTDER